MRTSDFDYDLPRELIAQCPVPERSASRMMVVSRHDGSLAHRSVRDLPDILHSGDLLVVNDTRVVRARTTGTKDATGGKVEVLFLGETSQGTWDTLFRASRRPVPGTRITLANGRLRAIVVSVGDGGRTELTIQSAQSVMQVLEEEGRVPLPPYIKRPQGEAATDGERYQTVYARVPGSVAAPTAGLHFTPELLARLGQGGMEHVAVTLHVGLGTFVPVTAEIVDEHRMAAEHYEVGRETADAISTARNQGRRIVAVGSTTVRTLETVAARHGSVARCAGESELFIRPPYRFRAVDAILTNFHLPCSTLIMMVSAFAGRELVMHAYKKAIENRYRFFSYGDSMLIL